MSSRSNLCYKCNQPGHFARECPDGDNGGGRSGGRGSYSGGGSYGGRGGSYGSSSRGGGGGGSSFDRSIVRCYRCNQTGHFVRDCPSDSNESVCYNCNLSGHLSRDCREPRAEGNQNFRGGSSRGGNVCYRCSKPGHFARECPEPDTRGGPPNVSAQVTADEDNN